MSWPSANDYVDAVQNPRWAFGDPDLQSAAIECDPLGLPRPRSGNFATVFKATADGARAWAVRCFTREVSGQGERYAAITAELGRHKWPFLRGFTYLPEGIRVRGAWHPLLKMEWVQGDGLIRYVDSHLGSPERLRSLADGLSDIVRTLSSNGIAHGDLQHGNILVVNGQPVLIDYDGMFVPGFAGHTATELGLPNY